VLFTLKPYQDVAARDVLGMLTRCREEWHGKYQGRNAFALTAAAAVIEALIHGSDEFDIEPDSGAAVLWVSHDPSLNVQTKHRFIEVADRIPVGDLVLLDSDFAEERLLPGTVYFINPDKLRTGGLFTRKTDKRQITFWEVLDNTVKDRSLTLYVVLDEAHEGMKAPSRNVAADNQTIVQKIINGNGSNAAVPIVWGISATVARFNEAMAKSDNRGTKPNIVIDPKEVQESGLIKSTVHADIPDEKGEFVTAFVRRATEDFAVSCTEWETYCATEGIEPVLPLLVIQIPNRADGDFTVEDKLIAECLDIVRRTWPGFGDDCVAHVLGDRTTIDTGAYTIPKVAPEDIEGDTRIRVLIAKDAVSTGWDCPRAEVLVSLRPANEHTYITQLLGRMVRTPLARSTSVARLNAAACYLPKFDLSTAQQVVEEITGQRDPARRSNGNGGSGPKVLWKPVTLTWNEEVPTEVKALVESLPSFPKPATEPKPIKRLLAACPVFAQDGLIVKPNEEAHKHLIDVLNGIAARYADRIDATATDIKTAEIKRISASYGGKSVTHESDADIADMNTVNEALRAAKRALSTSMVNSYWKTVWEKAILADPFADMMDVKARVAALGHIQTPEGAKTVVQEVEDAADALVRSWLDSKHDDIKLLPESRRAAYDVIRAGARDMEQVDIELPVDDRVDSVDAERKPLPTADKHILSDAHGNYPLDPKLNAWERAVIARETARDAVVAWYRNPSAASKHSLRIGYKQDGMWKSLQPDFIFIERDSSGALKPSIVDPHGGWMSDAMPKLLAMVQYAEDHRHRFARIEALSSTGASAPLRRLDLTDAKLRAAIRAANERGESVPSLFADGGPSISY
jgi:type III restriction enzyme